MKILRVIDEKTGSVFIALPLTEARYKDLTDWIDSKTTIKELRKQAKTAKKTPRKTPKKEANKKGKTAKKTPKKEKSSGLERARNIYAWCEDNLTFRIIVFALGGGILLAQLIKGLIF